MTSSTNTTSTVAVQLRDHFEVVKPGVTRTHLAKDERNQFALIQLSAGTRLPEHTAPRHVSVTVLDGRGTLTVGGREVALEPGVFVYMPANTPHAVYATENLAFLHT
jgi:quercetin dioxygenase-like cupin family protein